MPGRNDACPCGSGKKFKNCCVDKGSGISKGVLLLIAVIAAIAAIGILPSVLGQKKEKETNFTSSLPAGRRVPQPGPAQPGKVWSAEHGHWHDAETRNVMPLSSGTMPTPTSPVQVQSAPAPAFTPGPQPPGPVPAGKVWSTEHGHWHDAPK
jgi:hypothetical protein